MQQPIANSTVASSTSTTPQLLDLLQLLGAEIEKKESHLKGIEKLSALVPKSDLRSPQLYAQLLEVTANLEALRRAWNDSVNVQGQHESSPNLQRRIRELLQMHEVNGHTFRQNFHASKVCDQCHDVFTSDRQALECAGS